MDTASQRRKARLKRKMRIRKRVSGTPQRPRLSVFRSKKHIYAQIIDDTQGETIVAASTLEKQVRENQNFDNKVAIANYIGKLVGERALEQNVKQIVFDRSGYLYHGRIKAVSEGAREAGLDF
jgi:large subunit ribosomal protein L18